MLSRLREILAEVLYPPFCVSCKANGEWWCTMCQEKTEIISSDVCPACFALIHESPCEIVSPLDGVIPVGFYHDPQLRSVIWSLKYQGGTCVVPSLRRFLQSWKTSRHAPWPWAGHSTLAIVPVPTSEHRQRERGFDQADVLADAISAEIIPWARVMPLLSRVRDVPPQAGVDVGPLRFANVHEMFRVSMDTPLPEHVVLVDDVATSGATLMEAARTLKKRGVTHVYAVVLAVGK